MNSKKRFNYNDIELVRIIADKVCEEKDFNISPTITTHTYDIYDFKKEKDVTIEEIKIDIGFLLVIIDDRKEIYIDTEHLKNRIKGCIDGFIAEGKRRNEEYRRIKELEEKKKREFQENFDKLTPEMKAFFYVATALGREYLQACKYQNSYTVQNPYYHNNLLDNFLL
jgi:hypothetical protein